MYIQYAMHIYNSNFRSVHEGIKHACDQCDYVTGYAGALKVHKKAKHEGRVGS